MVTIEDIRQLLREELVDIKQAHGIRFHLIEELRTELDDCQDNVAALLADRDSANHNEINARTALLTWRSSAERRRDQSKALEDALQAKQDEIKRLQTRIAELENSHE